jgi:SpoIID/LytB domain protein
MRCGVFLKRRNTDHEDPRAEHGLASEENTIMNFRNMNEPKIKVGIMKGIRKVMGTFNGLFRIHDHCLMEGDFHALVDTNQVILFNNTGAEVARQHELRCTPVNGSTFTLFDVTIGVQFHWERTQKQTFRGILTLLSDENETLVAINEILLEDYLVSVIASEMSAQAPLEFLKSHAIISRSWLVSMLQRLRKDREPNSVSSCPIRHDHEIIRWYGREDHKLFDVCADDHCQRYQGITPSISINTRDAVDETRGVFLTHEGGVCDARYHKACGGLTDNFESAWEDIPVPYLSSIPDSTIPYKPVATESDAEQWMTTHPDAYCNMHDRNLLRQILPSFDQGTTDFFRWKVMYGRGGLDQINRVKTRRAFGTLFQLTPVERGPSGRIVRLKIEGSKKTAIIGKELEIRRWLSRSHLYSSAFVVSTDRDASGFPTRFIFHGAGWGHGVGLCQIGAAVMAVKGYSAEDILKHYFFGTRLQQLY